MATTTQTTPATKTAGDLELTPPDPVPMVVAEKAAGLVPVDAEKKTALQQKVEGFVDELIAKTGDRLARLAVHLGNEGQEFLMELRDAAVDRLVVRRDELDGAGRNEHGRSKEKRPQAAAPQRERTGLQAHARPLSSFAPIHGGNRVPSPLKLMRRLRLSKL